MIRLTGSKQMERAAERARQARLIVRRTSIRRMYKVENRDNGQVYTCNFFVRMSDGAKFGHCTCKAGNPPTDIEGIPMYTPKLCRHIAVSICLAVFDEAVRRVAATIPESPKAA